MEFIDFAQLKPPASPHSLIPHRRGGIASPERGSESERSPTLDNAVVAVHRRGHCLPLRIESSTAGCPTGLRCRISVASLDLDLPLSSTHRSLRVHATELHRRGVRMPPSDFLSASRRKRCRWYTTAASLMRGGGMERCDFSRWLVCVSECDESRLGIAASADDPRGIFANSRAGRDLWSISLPARGSDQGTLRLGEAAATTTTRATPLTLGAVARSGKPVVALTLLAIQVDGAVVWRGRMRAVVAVQSPAMAFPGPVYALLRQRIESRPCPWRLALVAEADGAEPQRIAFGCHGSASPGEWLREVRQDSAEPTAVLGLPLLLGRSIAASASLRQCWISPLAAAPCTCEGAKKRGAGC